MDVDVCNVDDGDTERDEEDEEEERTFRRTISSTTRFILFFISTLRDESLRKCDSVQLVAIFNMFASKSCAVGNGRLRVFSFPRGVVALASTQLAPGVFVALEVVLALEVFVSVEIFVAVADEDDEAAAEARITSCKTTSPIPSLQTPSLPLLLFAKHHPNLAGPISHTSLFNANKSSVLTPPPPPAEEDLGPPDAGVVEAEREEEVDVEVDVE